MQHPKILFFIDGMAPTLDEQVEAESLMPCRIMFRNANFVDPAQFLKKDVVVDGEIVSKSYGSFEPCDGVHGAACPKAYKSKFPDAKTAVQLYTAAREKMFADSRAKVIEAADAASTRRVALANKDVVLAGEAATLAAKATEQAAANLAKASGQDQPTPENEKVTSGEPDTPETDSETPTEAATAQAASDWTNS